MIVYHKHHEINKEQWDDCILNSPGIKPYAYSWYLDIISPGWEALIDDDYDAVFPLTCSRKFGIQYIATPIFLQQLGAFSPDKSQADAIAEFLTYMPEFYKLIDLCVGQKILLDEYIVTEKANYELDMSVPYYELWKGFNSDCRRNINIAVKSKPELTNYVSPEELIELFITNYGTKVKGIKSRDYDRLKNLITYCITNNKGEIIGVRTTGRRLIFGLFLVQISGSVTVLFTANSTESREKRIGYFVINEIIKSNATSDAMLDFAGSSIPSVASFMESFGSVNNPYYRIYHNRLFWPVRLMK